MPATANLVPALAVEIFEAFERGDHAAAKAAQLRLNPLRLALGLGTVPGGVKAALALDGPLARPLPCAGRPALARKRTEDEKSARSKPG